MRIHPELPIYCLDRLPWPILYAPGNLALVDREAGDLIRAIWSGRTDGRANIPNSVSSAMTWITDQARKAMAARRDWLAAEYKPECLTVYLSNRCNISCVYCFANSHRERKPPSLAASYPILRDEVFQGAAKRVVRNCAENGRPFQLTLHGGGEPSIHWDVLVRFVEISKSSAEKAGVDWVGYMATNGIMPVERAKWLGTTFQRIGLSCDGPPDIQNRQRPLINGGETAGWVKQTAGAVRKAGARLEIRTTLTVETAGRQKEIALYLIRELQPESIRFEPSYRVGGGDWPGIIPEEVDAFADGFMEARQTAINFGVELDFSGVRLEELHGPYCNTLRQVLHLTPDGAATACFFCVDGQDPAYGGRIIGNFDRTTGSFWLDSEKIDRLRHQSAEIKGPCHGCFAAFHCARACPEICGAGKGLSPDPVLEESFRCRLNRTIGQRLIEEAAKDFLKDIETTSLTVNSQAVPNQINRVLEAVSEEIKRKVISQWQAAASRYKLPDREMPPPLWLKRGFQYDAERSWQKLRRIIRGSPPDPISIYVHIPFCRARCGFCDCYSLATPPNHRLHREYVQGLLKEVMLWGQVDPLRKRPITTIHFGGGTPSFLHPDYFKSIISTLDQQFHTTEKTEWAVESTVSLLDDRQLTQLSKWGIKRLHIGVQTLEEPLRQQIGRLSSTETALERIRHCLEAGFITSVDLIYGLPGETASGFITTVDQLIELGVHGFSFYRFNRSGRNRRFIKQWQFAEPGVEHDYALFLVADLIMGRAGFKKNHFSHYAAEEDQNLYYTHAQRGEDLLGLGASADGVFNGFHYRYLPLSAQTLRSHSGIPQFQGGVKENAREGKAATAVAQLMTGAIHKEVINELGLNPLVDQWTAGQLIKEEEGGFYQLTGNGSWFIQTMIQMVEEKVDLTRVL